MHGDVLRREDVFRWVSAEDLGLSLVVVVVPVLSQCCYAFVCSCIIRLPMCTTILWCAVAIPEKRAPKQNRVVVAVYDRLCLVVVA